MDYGYKRVSTGGQDADNQDAKLATAGIDPANIYADTASGAKASRPGWDALRAKLAPGDTVTAVRLDRIGRSVVNLGEIAEDFNRRDIALILTDQPIDTRTPMGRFIYVVLAAVAEFERALIIERTADGQAKVRADQNLKRSTGGAPPFGFRDGDGDWIMDDRAGAALADLAGRVLAPGGNVHAAWADMEAEREAAGRPPLFTAGTDNAAPVLVNEKIARAALYRPASAGLIVTARDADGEPAELTPSKVAGPLEPAVWRQLQRRRLANRKTGRTPSEVYALGRLLRCSVCGNQLTGQPGYKGRPVFACKNPHPAMRYAPTVPARIGRPGQPITRACRGVSIYADEAEAVIRAATEGAAAGSDRFARAAGRDAELTEAARAADARIADLADMQGELFRLRRLGDITPAQYATEREALAAELAAERAVAAELAAAAASPAPVSLDWADLAPGAKRDLVADLLVTPISVRPGTGGGAAVKASERLSLAVRAEDDAAA